MENFNLTAEIIGYIASFLLVVTFFLRNVKWLRIVGSFACLGFVIYGCMFPKIAYPLVIANVLIILINIFYVIKDMTFSIAKYRDELPSGEEQQNFMREAIKAADVNIDALSGGPFGAVIVKDGKIIAVEANHVTTSNDPTSHAEVNAIRAACKKLGTHDLSDCEIYASCEPCPMCLASIYWARISKIYYAASREDATQAGFDDSLIYDEISKKQSERIIPIMQIIPQEGGVVLKKWIETEGKIAY
jgi:tRNA(Arg) A34 adenosine deaminase TadA